MQVHQIAVPSKYENSTMHHFYFYLNIAVPLLVGAWTIFQIYNTIKLKDISKKLDKLASVAGKAASGVVSEVAGQVKNVVDEFV